MAQCSQILQIGVATKTLRAFTESIEAVQQMRERASSDRSKQTPKLQVHHSGSQWFQRIISSSIKINSPNCRASQKRHSRSRKIGSESLSRTLQSIKISLGQMPPASFTPTPILSWTRARHTFRAIRVSHRWLVPSKTFLYRRSRAIFQK